MANKEVLATVVRIPDSEIVVVRKVPMTEKTCDELRILRAYHEKQESEERGFDVELPFPTLIQRIIHEAAEALPSDFNEKR